MCEQIEVVYENGVLRPLSPMPREVREHQRLTVAIVAPAANLEAVRQVLAKAPGTLAQAVHQEREER